MTEMCVETHIYFSIRISNGTKWQLGLASAYLGLGKQDEINMNDNVHYNTIISRRNMRQVITAEKNYPCVMTQNCVCILCLCLRAWNPQKGACLLSVVFNQCNSVLIICLKGITVFPQQVSHPAAVWSSQRGKSNAKSLLHYSVTFIILCTIHEYLGLNFWGRSSALYVLCKVDFSWGNA